MPRTEEPGGLQSAESQRDTTEHAHMHKINHVLRRNGRCFIWIWNSSLAKNEHSKIIRFIKGQKILCSAYCALNFPDQFVAQCDWGGNEKVHVFQVYAPILSVNGEVSGGEAGVERCMVKSESQLKTFTKLWHQMRASWDKRSQWG